MAQEPTPPSQFEVLAAGEKFGDYQVMEVLAAGPLAALYRLQSLSGGKDEFFLVPPAEAASNSLLKVRMKESVGRFSRFDTASLWRPESTADIAGRPCCRLNTRELIPLCRWMALQLGTRNEDLAPIGATLPVFPKGVPVPKAKTILVEIAAAVEAAHIAGFKHFALDPRWVFVTPEGKVALAGFNFAEILGIDLLTLKVKDSKGITQTGFPSDFDYLAPEVRRGQQADYPADAFGFGTIAFYLLTGQRPSFRLSRDAVRETPPISSLQHSVPNDWDAFVAKLLTEDPSRRPDVFDKLKAELMDLPTEKMAVTKAKQKSAGKGAGVSIPLPASVSGKLSPRGLQMLRVGLLLLFGVSVVVLGWMASSVFSENVPQGGLVAVETIEQSPPGRKPHLFLSISPGKCSLKIFGPDGLTGSFAVNSGNIQLSMPRGSYKLIAIARDHQNASLDNVVVDGRDTAIRTLRLVPEWGLLSVKGTPGATVVAKRENGEETRHGPIPPEGLLVLDQHLFKGSYTISVEKPHHDSVVREGIVVTDKNNDLEAHLKPHPASVMIKSDPAGASVYLEGKEVGKTPLRLSDLPVDKQLDFTIRAAAFRERKFPVTLVPGEDLELDTGDLRAALGNLNLVVLLGDRPADPADYEKLSIFVGAARLAAKEKYEALPAGKVTIRVDHPDYETYTDEPVILDSGTVTVRAILPPKMGRLRVVTNPPVAVSLMNWETQQPLASEGNNVFLIPPFKRVEVEARALDFESKRAFFTLKANERGEWKLELARLAPPKPGSAYTVPMAGVVFNWAPAGSFLFGSPAAEQAREPSEGPETTITFAQGFWAAKHEITQEEYIRVMSVAKRTTPTLVLNPSKSASKQTLNHPVQNLSWEDAGRYCRLLTDWERAGGRLPKGYIYRLPTEAEWEYVARAGSATPFHFEGTADASKGQFQGFYPRENPSSVTSRFANTAPVGSFSQNAWGFHDVHGNVREWCHNWFASRLPGGNLANWAGPAVGKMRSVRGGAWEMSAKECRVAARDSRLPDNLSSATGFRPFLAPEL